MENIFEYLIPLIFIVSFLSMRGKKKKQAKTEEAKQVEKPKVVQAPKKSATGIFGKLNKMMEEYYESDQEQAPQQKTKSGTRTDPFQMAPPRREPEPWEDDDDVYEPVPEPVMMEVEQEEVDRRPASRPDNPPPEETKTEVVQARPKVVEMETELPAVPDDPFLQSDSRVPVSASYRLGEMNQQDLRRAIVWSEILGPPKALRED